MPPRIERRRCTLEVWSAARGLGSWLGAQDELLGRAEFKVTALLTQRTRLPSLIASDCVAVHFSFGFQHMAVPPTGLEAWSTRLCC